MTSPISAEEIGLVIFGDTFGGMFGDGRENHGEDAGMKHLGIDYGTARTGLAVSDETGTLARPYDLLRTSDRIVEEIALIVEREEIGRVVLGMPYDLRGARTETTERVALFLEALRERLDCEVVEQDEALSSRRAVERMVEAGVRKSKRRRKGTTDTWAAALILQEYLDNLE